MWDSVFVTGTRPTLRERRRQDLTDEIKDVARRHLASEGLGALSLRAIARDVGMAVSALYRYFPSRDDLITALLEEAFTAQAEAVETAAGDGPDDPVAALRAALLAFREWSVSHPAECRQRVWRGSVEPTRNRLLLSYRVAISVKNRVTRCPWTSFSSSAPAGASARLWWE